MKSKLIGENIEITDEIRDMVERKLISKVDKLLQDFEEDIKIADISFQRLENEHFKVKFNMWLPGKKHIFAHAQEKNLINSLVELRKDVLDQIKTYKGKLNRGK